jgi:hypothetical protein
MIVMPSLKLSSFGFSDPKVREYFRFEQYQRPETFLIDFKAYVGKYRLSISY